MPRPLVLAHRGARRVAPENTVEAFARALAQGADGVELDVHRTADGGLVVHHDAEVAGLGVLAERTVAEIRAANPAVPTLEEALDACTGAIVNIEIKNLPGDADFDPDESAADLVVALLAAREQRDEVIISSFSLATVDRAHELDPTLETALLAMIGFDPYDALDVCVGRGHAALHPFVGMLAGPSAQAVTERAHELGVRVRVWTVNDEDEIRRLADVDVDGIITDVPDVARQQLTGRRA